MTDAPFHPHHQPATPHADEHLHEGPVDGPDILEGSAEGEPDFDDVEFADNPDFRVPQPGEHLTPEELDDVLGE